MHTNDESTTFSADLAENDPEHDQLGYAPLAQSIAKGIAKMAPVEGLTMAIAGGWGTGKTTTINFVRHYLKEIDGAIEIVDFNPWWFSGHEDLVRKLLQQIASAVQPTTDQGRKLGGLLHDLAEIVDTMPVELKPSVFGFSIDLKKVASLSAEKMRQTKPIPQLKREIGELLKDLGIKFLVVVDDVDRLSVNEIRDLFRAVKSVGDLPNVIYLIALDRDVVSKSLDDCFPERGGAYLDKIIQVSFDLPAPSQAGIQSIFLTGVNKLLESVSNNGTIDSDWFWSVYRVGTGKLLTSPRHVVRLLNALYVTLSSLVGEVNIADFIALEASRLFRPELYAHIRDNKEQFVGAVDYHEKSDRENKLRAFHLAWIAERPTAEQAWLREFLPKLFPKVEYTWSNTIYGAHYLAEWRRNLRICSPDIFDTYFKFTIPADGTSAVALKTFIEGANSGNCKDLIIDAVRSNSVDVKNRLWALIDRLEDHLDDSVTPVGGAAIFLDVLTAWTEYVDVPGVATRQWAFDNELILTGVLYKALRRADSNNRTPLMETAIKQRLCPPVMLRLLASIGASHGKFGEAYAESGTSIFTADQFTHLAENFCTEIQYLADTETSLPSNTWSRMLHFVGEISPDRLTILRYRLLQIPMGIIGIASSGMQELISIIGERNKRESPFKINIPQVAVMCDPAELVAPIQRLVEEGTLDERSLGIANSFLKTWVNWNESNKSQKTVDLTSAVEVDGWDDQESDCTDKD